MTAGKNTGRQGVDLAVPTDLSHLLAGRRSLRSLAPPTIPSKFGRPDLSLPQREGPFGRRCQPESLRSRPRPRVPESGVTARSTGHHQLGGAGRCRRYGGESGRALGLDNVWVQPGAEGPELEARLAAGGFSYSVHDCIMNRT